MVSHKTQDEKSVLLLYITDDPSVCSERAADYPTKQTLLSRLHFGILI